MGATRPGTGDKLREPRRGNAGSTEGRPHDERVGGGRRVLPVPTLSDRGAASRGERPGYERDRSPARVCGTSGQVTADRAAGMGNRTERQSTPIELSLPSMRGDESGARSLVRITQRECACPCWTDRSESSARSYAVVPGPGTDPPGFCGGKRWQSLKVNPVSPMTDAAGNGKSPQR